MNPEQQRDLLGKRVRVTNTQLESSLDGELVGFADHPTMLLKTDSGHQCLLPQSFKVEVIDAPPVSRESPTAGVAHEKRYTLAEARRELNRRECAGRGHDIDVVYNGLSVDPSQLVCGRCGDSWNVQPKETT